MTKTTQPRPPRSCAHLGVCQSRPGCDDCARLDTHTRPPGGFFFAPGTVEESHKSARKSARKSAHKSAHKSTRKTARTDTIGRWLLTAAALAAFGAVIGISTGWLNVKGFL